MKIITIDKACDMLGFVGKSKYRYQKIRNLIKEGKIKRYSKFRSLLFDEEEIKELQEEFFNKE